MKLSIGLIFFMVIVLTGCSSSFQVTWMMDENTVYATLSIESGDAFSFPDHPTKDGYTFLGWYLDHQLEIPYNKSIIIDKDTVFYPKWQANLHTITFEIDEGITMFTIPMAYGSPIVIPDEPVKEGYRFLGWNQEIPNLMPDEDLTMRALWQIEQFEIRFQDDMGEIYYTNIVEYDTDLTTLEIIVPERIAYTFLGWNIDIPSTMPAHDLIIEAMWKANQYTITFVSEPGSIISSFTQDYGTPIDVPENPYRDGYVFLGWDQAIPSTMPAENITISARWARLSDQTTIADPNLYSAIMTFFDEHNLDFNHNDEMDKEEIEQTYWLDIRDSNVSSLAGIEMFIHLETLYLSFNNITDITPLLSMTQLKTVILDNNLLTTSEFLGLHDEDLLVIEELHRRGVNTYQSEKTQKIDFDENRSNLEDTMTWNILVIIVSNLDTLDLNGAPLTYQMSEMEISIAKENARLLGLGLEIMMDYNIHFHVDFYVTNEPYRGSFMGNSSNHILFAPQIDEVKEMLPLYDSSLVVLSLPNPVNAKDHSPYHQAAGYGSFDVNENIGTAMIYLDSYLLGYIINNEPIELEYHRLLDNSVTTLFWLSVHEIIHTIEFYGLSLGLPVWEFHNAIVQYSQKLIEWTDYDIYQPYLNGAINPLNSNEYGITDEIWNHPPRLRNND